MTERPRYPKRHCCVPGCRRTSTLFKEDFLCADHWKLVPRAMKTLRTKLVRRHRKAWYKAEREYQIVGASDTKESWLAHRNWTRVDNAWRRTSDGIWRRMKRAAIERACGI